MADVVGLDGKRVETAPQLTQLQRDCVDVARQLLADAEAGKIIGILAVWIEPASEPEGMEHVSNSWCGQKFTLMGGLARIQHRLNLDIDKVMSEQQGR